MAKHFIDVNKKIIDAIFALDDVEDIDPILDDLIDDYGMTKAKSKAGKSKEDKSSKKSKQKDKVIELRKVTFKRL